jgi:hypothetical protein
VKHARKRALTLVAVLITAGLSVALYAQDLEWGRAFFSKNEWHLQSTNIDPPKVRLGASHGHILGSVSGNRVTLGGREVEIALMTFKLDERNRCNPDNLSGRIEFWVLDHSKGEGDNAYTRVALFDKDRVWFIGQPEPPGTPTCAGGYRR